MKKWIVLAVSMLLGFSCEIFAQDQAADDPDQIYATELLKAGTPAPNFQLNDINGNPVRLSDFRGRKVVLVFWASWCPDCREEVPELKAMYKAADPSAVAFVSVSFDRKLETLVKYAKDNSLPGIQLFDPAGKKDSEVCAAYHVKWIPSLYLIDAEGKVQLSTVVISKVAAALKK